MKIIYVKNFRKGLATNSSSTHSLIYRNDGELFRDLNIFECNYYDRCTKTVAATREAKIKYVLADIMYNDALVEIMSGFYPEMKQYYPLVKKHFEKDHEHDGYNEGLGMYCRGKLYFDDNIEASVDYLRNVIENPEIIIVGGSDEQDFVYDTIEGHDKCPDPDGIDLFGKYKNMGVTKNGNYWVGYGDTNDRIVVKDNDNDNGYYNPTRHCFGGRMRYMTEEGEPVPEFPELIDIKVTNKCNRGCAFCLDGDTLIDTNEGTKKISEIKEGDMVLSFNELNYEFQVKPVNGVSERDYEGDIYEIELENGKTLKCTPNHKIYTINRGWIKAENITENDDVLIF